MEDIKKVYADSLMDISESSLKSNIILDELLSIKSCFDKDKDIYKLLDGPILSKSQKENVLDNIFKNKISTITLNFLKVLVKNKRIKNLSEIVECYKDIYNEKNGILDFVIITVKPLTQFQIEKLSSHLKNVTNKVVKIKNQIDEKIVGGVILKVKNNQIDVSIKNKLNQISELICNKSI